MRFVDEAKIQVRAGKGGHGCVSFRREKFVPRGGPDGGNGGDGGSVYLRADNRLLSLYDFRLKRLYEAQTGQPGQGSQCDGKKGTDLVLGLPVTETENAQITAKLQMDMQMDVNATGDDVRISYPSFSNFEDLTPVLSGGEL